MNIVQCSMTTAELSGVHKGLALAWHYGVLKLKVEIDSLYVVQLLKGIKVVCNYNGLLISNIRQYLNREWEVSIVHIYRESNFAADALAFLAANFPLGYHELGAASNDLLDMLYHDIEGV
ncbi:nucleic acid binding protein, putative [Ricinus communis]|uniref:Nucleic acid binding protein, putative n=1 Tax=Ricinus communis TaxID=3988 RepID=B9RHM1_RICCO|nr:nucleic acid binding protein, putative [Ricinus communis]